MKIIGLMRVRNVEWIIRYSIPAALQWLDALVVLDHASTDGTTETVMRLTLETKGRLSSRWDPDPEWHEMAQLNRMLAVARELGASHVAIVDADEVLTADLVPVIRGMVEALKPAEVLRVPWHNLWRSCDQYRDDRSKHGKQMVSLVFRDAPDLHWPEVEQFNHRQPVGIMAAWETFKVGRSSGVMHLQRVRWDRAVARQRLYKMREALRGAEPLHVIDARYSSALDETGAVLKQVSEHWWAHGLDRGLIDLEAEPWEKAECERLLSEHGHAKFAGLSL